ncbi:MAG: hypothetical protein RBT76_05145 [candidate division Zixibacteria bacterium]|nr:hypothetical protein [candidate division Zixibacteria bacterium]
MKRSSIVILSAVVVLFLVSWILKGASFSGDDNPYLRGFLTTAAAFLTLAVFSFLYQDNPFYKFAEHLFVGVSAAYWMVLGFWQTLVRNLIPRLSSDLAAWFETPSKDISLWYIIPVIFGLLLLMRLSKSAGWISRWPLALIIGYTAGINFVGYMRSDFVNQIAATFVPLLVNWQGTGAFFSDFSLAIDGQFVMMLSNWVIFVGVMCGLIYFFFSKEHTGLFGSASRVGIWILMITFGASFGYTVMGRISLLVGRLTFLFRDWLELIG